MVGAEMCIGNGQHVGHLGCQITSKNDENYDKINNNVNEKLLDLSIGFLSRWMSSIVYKIDAPVSLLICRARGNKRLVV
jgi:hypothetical protein